MSEATPKQKDTVEAYGLEFAIILEPDLEEGGYIAHCPALKGCWSQGETIDETLTNIADAIIGCLAVRVERAIARARAELPEGSSTSHPLSIPVQIPYG